MWELYAMWALVPAFLTASLAGRVETGLIDLAGFGVIAAGGAGAVLAGLWADRVGKENAAFWMMVLSGGCALAVGWGGMWPPALLIPLCLVWGFAVVADSAQLSALVTEVAPSHVVGTALTLQTMLGFALTAVSIEFGQWLATNQGWGWAFLMLAVGPMYGCLQMIRLKALRHGNVDASNPA